MILSIKVKPRAKKERIEEVNGIIKVYVNEPAENGCANKKAIKMLAKHFGVKKYNISIIKGKTSREKVISIDENS